MIIKMTVHDNDHTQLIERFADKLYNRIYFSPVPRRASKEASIEEQLELIHTEREIQKLLNPNITERLTVEDKTLLKAAVFLNWCDFVDSCSKKDSTKEYLKKNFRVSISYTFKDRWENSEAVYYFTTGQKWLSQ